MYDDTSNVVDIYASIFYNGKISCVIYDSRNHNYNMIDDDSQNSLKTSAAIKYAPNYIISDEDIQRRLAAPPINIRVRDKNVKYSYSIDKIFQCVYGMLRSHNILLLKGSIDDELNITFQIHKDISPEEIITMIRSLPLLNDYRLVSDKVTAQLKTGSTVLMHYIIAYKDKAYASRFIVSDIDKNNLRSIKLEDITRDPSNIYFVNTYVLDIKDNIFTLKTGIDINTSIIKDLIDNGLYIIDYQPDTKVMQITGNNITQDNIRSILHKYSDTLDLIDSPEHPPSSESWMTSTYGYPPSQSQLVSPYGYPFSTYPSTYGYPPSQSQTTSTYGYPPLQSQSASPYGYPPSTYPSAYGYPPSQSQPTSSYEYPPSSQSQSALPYGYPPSSES